MKRLVLAVISTALIVSCAGTAPAPRVTPPSGESRFLIDPRTGAPAPADPSLDRRFDAAWRSFLAADYTNARTRAQDLRRRDANYAPAALFEAALDLREGNITGARSTVTALEQKYPDWLAPMAYEAEVALADHQTRRAWEIYRTLAARADAPPIVRDRLTDLEKRLFDELYHAALSASDADAIAALRQALVVSPNATGARVLLGQKLIAQKQYDEARIAVEPLVNSADVDRNDVQELLAEVEVGRGQYEQAINRYERLARRESDPRFARRLEQVKQQWNAANMPPQYQRAMQTDSLTRGDFAVLLYWLVPSVRFAQNLSVPPIATDLGDVSGREEIVRAIALGILPVDAVTRRVGPATPVNAPALERLVARVLVMRGAACTRGVANDAVLQACGITPVAVAPDAPVSGATASAMLEQVAKALAR
ncbi:MAG: tetratricopeptide repeat protein [Thermoanaerobaculia bacterium]